MKEERETVYDRKKLIIVRAVLIAIGGALGGTLVWQYFVYYPQLMRQEYRIVVIAVSAAVLAALLGLSAKPFYRLGSSIAAVFVKIAGSLGARGVTAVIAGLTAAALLAFLFDVVIRGALDIIAVRLLADVLVYLCFSALCCYGFVKWIASADEEEKASEFAPSGYLLTASCFTDDRVFTAADFLTGAKIYDGAFKALWKFCDDRDALARLKLVLNKGAITIIKCSKEYESAEEYAKAEAEVALCRRLKPICAEGCFPFIDGAADIASFVAPTEVLISAFKCADDGADRDTRTAENAESDETSLTNRVV